MKRRSHSPFGVKILHEDEDVIVVYKEPGVLSQSTRGGDDRCVESILGDWVRKGQWKSSRRVYLVHRLDRETSGVMMVAKNERAMEWLREHWNEVTQKTYLALVEGEMPTAEGFYESRLMEDERYFVRSVKDHARGKFARTEWKIAGEEAVAAARLPLRAGCTLVEATLKTGRKNQIRVQFSEDGHPVVGDHRYGNGRRGAPLMLHAWRLSFEHPRTHERLTFSAPAPASWARGGGR